MFGSRAKKDKESLLDHKDVPYISERVKASARPFLPEHSRAELDAGKVDAFVQETAHDPDTRLAVLGVLRTHASNGAEVVLSGFALLLSVVGVALAATQQSALSGWTKLIPVVEVIALLFVVLGVLRLAGAAHIRKITALVWLATYEDALKQPPTPARRWPWRR